MKNILIVEDEPDIQELLCAYLRNAGYAPSVAGDGVAALTLFQSRPFDLVLLDIMPVSYTHLDVYKRQLHHLDR